jgi:hypothetical protein
MQRGDVVLKIGGFIVYSAVMITARVSDRVRNAQVESEGCLARK